MGPTTTVWKFQINHLNIAWALKFITWCPWWSKKLDGGRGTGFSFILVKLGRPRNAWKAKIGQCCYINWSKYSNKHQTDQRCKQSVYFKTKDISKFKTLNYGKRFQKYVDKPQKFCSTLKRKFYSRIADG